MQFSWKDYPDLAMKQNKLRVSTVLTFIYIKGLLISRQVKFKEEMQIIPLLCNILISCGSMEVMANYEKLVSHLGMITQLKFRMLAII